jgi:hypothetical protein
MTEGKNRIMIFGPKADMIFGPKADGTYVIEFRPAKGEVLAISVPRGETAVLQHFQPRMPYGLFVPDLMAQRAMEPRHASAMAARR